MVGEGRGQRVAERDAGAAAAVRVAGDVADAAHRLADGAEPARAEYGPLWPYPVTRVTEARVDLPQLLGARPQRSSVPGRKFSIRTSASATSAVPGPASRCAGQRHRLLVAGDDRPPQRLAVRLLAPHWRIGSPGRVLELDDLGTEIAEQLAAERAGQQLASSMTRTSSRAEEGSLKPPEGPFVCRPAPRCEPGQPGMFAGEASQRSAGSVNGVSWIAYNVAMVRCYVRDHDPGRGPRCGQGCRRHLPDHPPTDPQRRARGRRVAARGRPRGRHRGQSYTGARGPAPLGGRGTGPARAQSRRPGRALGGGRPRRDLQPPLAAGTLGVRTRRRHRPRRPGPRSASSRTGWTRRRGTTLPTWTSSQS